MRPRMTTKESFQTQVSSTNNTILSSGFREILRTGRTKSARKGWTKIRDSEKMSKRGDKELIKTDKKHLNRIYQRNQRLFDLTRWLSLNLVRRNNNCLEA